jgi:hypothetical protein
MPSSRASVFGEAENFQAALSADGVAGMLVTGSGQFRARLTQVRLERLRLSAVEEHLPRILLVPRSAFVGVGQMMPKPMRAAAERSLKFGNPLGASNRLTPLRHRSRVIPSKNRYCDGSRTSRAAGSSTQKIGSRGYLSAIRSTRVGERRWDAGGAASARCDVADSAVEEAVTSELVSERGFQGDSSA